MEKVFKIILIILVILIVFGIITAILYNNNIHIKNKINYSNKDDIISLLDKGLKSSSQVNIFIISRESLDDEYTKILNEGKYKDLIGFIDLDKYKSSEFEFIFLNETDECVLGYFSEKNDKTNGTTYIRVNKSNGELKELDNNLFKVTIY